MAARERKSDKRKSFRCPVDTSQQTGELRVRWRRRRVVLVNQSAGGFGALSERDLGLSVGDVVTLTIGGEQFDVRVAHVGQTGTIQPTGEAKLVFRVGLERVTESADFPGGWNGCQPRWRSLLPSGGVLILTMVLVATAVLGLLAVKDSPLARWGFRRRPRPDPQAPVIAESLSPAAERVAERLQSKAVPAAEPNPADVSQRMPSPPREPSATTPPPASRVAATDKRIQGLRGANVFKIPDLSGAAVFALPEVVRQLNLTGAQQAQMRRIMDAESAALRELDLPSQTSSPEERAAKRALVLERARREALETLTPEQRLQWQRRAGAENL